GVEIAASVACAHRPDGESARRARTKTAPSPSEAHRDISVRDSGGGFSFHDAVDTGKIAKALPHIHPVSDKPLEPRILESAPGRRVFRFPGLAEDRYRCFYLARTARKKSRFELFKRCAGITN